jgi:hypothetical protein
MLKKGFVLPRGVITIAVVIVVITTIITLASLVLRYVREEARRAMCACNLHSIGVALNTYANENRGKFPAIPLGSGQIVGEDKSLVNVKKNATENPFTDLPADANKSVSMNVWLLCRRGLTTHKMFLCPSAIDIKQDWECSGDGNGVPYNKAFSNFPWARQDVVISYSFPQPWSDTSNWTTTAKPGTVIGADANNGLQPDYAGDGLPLSNRKLKKYVNSTNHGGKVQCVLYVDASVSVAKSPYVGIDLDNIYTAIPENYTGKADETAGVLSVRPKDKSDAVLIPNKNADLAKWNRKP